MEAVRAGEVRSLGVLFDRHHASLYRFYVRITGNRDWSEDLTQEVFSRMLRHRDTYRPGARFTTWMYRIARNAHIDQVRKRRREVALEDGWDGAAAPGEPLERRQERALLRRALLALPQDKREVLVLSRFQGMSCEEIGELLGLETGSVRVRIHRALHGLREIFFELTGRKAS